MKGYVPTPSEIAARMVDTLFNESEPSANDRILFPGVGSGPFVNAVIEYCESSCKPIPEGVGVDTNPQHIATVRNMYEDTPITFDNRDFLDDNYNPGGFDYIIGNPPYVSIRKIDDSSDLKEEYETANGRFDLYFLFFEKGVDLLNSGGILMYLTTEKFEYVKSAEALRDLLTSQYVVAIDHLSPDCFPEHTNYPTVTQVSKTDDVGTTVFPRDGDEFTTDLPTGGDSWASSVRPKEANIEDTGVTLGDISKRISPGVATGANDLFIQNAEDVADQLQGSHTHPTISGREISFLDRMEHGDFNRDWRSLIICPYDEEGSLKSLSQLDPFKIWAEMHRSSLENRSCHQKHGKKWYAWHESPPMSDILGTKKLIFPDLTDEPVFRIDWDGEVVPAHSVYYLIPKKEIDIRELRSYLESPLVREWLESNCQRAANDYIRLQTHVLEKLPISTDLIPNSSDCTQ